MKHNLQEIKVWQKSIDLTKVIYVAIALLPENEKGGLMSQIKWSCVSVSLNIAEEVGRNSWKEFIHFLGISNGSAYELRIQSVIAQNLNLLEEQISLDLLSEVVEIQKMLFGFRNKLISDVEFIKTL